MSGRDRVAADALDEVEQAFDALAEARASWAVVARRARWLASQPAELPELRRWVIVRDRADQLARALAILEDDGAEAANVAAGDA